MRHGDLEAFFANPSGFCCMMALIIVVALVWGAVDSNKKHKENDQ